MPSIDDLTALVEQRAAEQQPATRLREAIDAGRELTELGDALIGHFVSDHSLERPVLDGDRAGVRHEQTGGATALRATGDDFGHWPGRWTAAANEALSRAAAEARVLGHDYVGTEHALLALATVERGTAGEVLRELGVTRERMLATSCMSAGADAHQPHDFLRAVPRFKQALEHSRRIADGLDVRHADTEHLLAGIVAVPDSMAVEILRRLGVSVDDVRAAIAERLDVDPERLGARRRRRRRLRAAAR